MADDKKSGPSGASVDHKKFQTLKTQAEQQAKDVSQAIGYMHSYLFVWYHSSITKNAWRTTQMFSNTRRRSMEQPALR